MIIKFANNEIIFNIHDTIDGEIPYLSFKSFDKLGVPNLFSSRYLSYDVKSGSGVKGLRTAIMKWEKRDEAAPVVQDARNRLAKQIGSSLEFECISDQKHTNYVHVAAKEDLGPIWPKTRPLHRQYVDGMVTDIPDALLTVFGGDCPPVYIVDPVRKAIGLVHAGWKGTLGRIPEVAIAQMVVKFGSDPSDMYAAIGPGICRDCYEMGDEIYDAFAVEWSREEADRILVRYPSGEEKKIADNKGNKYVQDALNNRTFTGKYHLDLRLANKMTLMRAGVREDRIDVSNVCTKCNADTFYSYRSGKMENEQAAMLVNRFKSI